MRHLTLTIFSAMLAIPTSYAQAPTDAASPSAPTRYAAIERLEFNRRAVEWAEPLFWVSDANGNGAIEPTELAILWGLGDGDRTRFVKDGAFTPHFDAVYDKFRQRPPLAGLGAEERLRREVVLDELAQGRPTLVQTELADPRDQRLAARLEKVARLVERLYARQTGVLGLDERIPADDTASRALFFRNQGPFCEAPRTETNPACNALADKPQKISGLYPASIQADPTFCEVLEARPDGDALMKPFVVVRHKDGGRADGKAATDELVAVPYQVAFADDMQAASKELLAAARVLDGDASETAFKGYLEAAAQAFLDGSWFSGRRRLEGDDGDELEVVPARRPGRDLLRAVQPQGRLPRELRADQPGLDRVAEEARSGARPTWKRRSPGSPGRRTSARQVSFHLPDFIDIVLNAGDSRCRARRDHRAEPAELGPGRERGPRAHGRDDQPLHRSRQRRGAARAGCARALQGHRWTAFDPAARHLSCPRCCTRPRTTSARRTSTRSTARRTTQVFGGPLASTLEELKAQTARALLRGLARRARGLHRRRARRSGRTCAT